jgi:hypothetical protein
MELTVNVLVASLAVQRVSPLMVGFKLTVLMVQCGMFDLTVGKFSHGSRNEANSSHVYGILGLATGKFSHSG